MRDSHENGHKIHGRKRLLRRILWRMDNAGKQQRHTEMVYELVAKWTLKRTETISRSAKLA